MSAREGPPLFGSQPAGQSERLPQIEDAAAQAGLGEHRGRFGPATAESMAWLTAFTVGFGALTVLFLVVSLIAALLPGALFMLFALVTARRSASNRDARDAGLDLFGRGLILASAERLQVVRYAETKVLQEIVHHSVNGRHNHSTFKYTLEDTDGAHVTIQSTTGRITAGMPSPDQWGPAIQRAVTDAQLPPARAAVAAGKRIEFGKFWVTRDDVGSGSRIWPWTQVSEIRVHNGLVQLKSANRWASVTDSEVSRIPNCLVFIALAEQLASGSTKS